MAKIYVITAGEYSSYHICGVALDLETAERMAKLHSTRWDPAEIEEYDTTEQADVNGEIVPVYYVKIYPDSSLECSISRYVLDSDPFVPEYELHEDWVHPPLVFYMETKARDNEHAIKIAADVRAKALNDYLIEHGETMESLTIKVIRKKDRLMMPMLSTQTVVLSTASSGGS